MKYKLVLLFGLFLIKITASNAEIAAYRSIPFTHSPLYALKGTEQFAGGTDSVALYYFEKKDNKLQSITYRIDGKYKPIYENYTSSNYIWASQNYFEYQENGFIIRHLDYLSRPLSDKPALSKYELDKEGRVVRLTFYGSSNEPVELNGVHEYNWKYFHDGVGEIRFSVNKQVRPISNWFPFYWVILNYDESDNLTTLLTTDKKWRNSNNTTKIDFTIDRGEIVKWVARNKLSNKKSINPGPGVCEVRHDFDQYGYLMRTRFYGLNGERVESNWGHMGFVRTYHSNGNRLSYNFIDEQDQITMSSRAYSGQRFIWDDAGMYRVRTYYTDELGKVVFRESSGYAQIQYIYDFNGVEIGTIYKDEGDNVICNDSNESFFLARKLNGTYKPISLCN